MVCFISSVLNGSGTLLHLGSTCCIKKYLQHSQHSIIVVTFQMQNIFCEIRMKFLYNKAILLCLSSCFIMVVILFQAQPINPEVIAKLFGNRVACSPIVTVEPRRRKFHKPITLTIPLPKAEKKGMINQYPNENPSLRLLCSITGKLLSPLAVTMAAVYDVHTISLSSI